MVEKHASKFSWEIPVNPSPIDELALLPLSSPFITYKYITINKHYKGNLGCGVVVPRKGNWHVGRKGKVTKSGMNIFSASINNTRNSTQQNEWMRIPRERKPEKMRKRSRLGPIFTRISSWGDLLLPKIILIEPICVCEQPVVGGCTFQFANWLLFGQFLLFLPSPRPELRLPIFNQTLFAAPESKDSWVIGNNFYLLLVEEQKVGNDLWGRQHG